MVSFSDNTKIGTGLLLLVSVKVFRLASSLPEVTFCFLSLPLSFACVRPRVYAVTNDLKIGSRLSLFGSHVLL